MDVLPNGRVILFPAHHDESVGDAFRGLDEELGQAFGQTTDLRLAANKIGASINVSIRINGPVVTIGWQSLAVAVVPALCIALGAWVGSRNGRTVSMKIGDIQVKAQTREEVEKLFARALEIQWEIEQLNLQSKLIP